MAILAPPRTRYRWNAAAHRYVDRRTGQFVSNATVRRAIDLALHSTEREILALADRLRTHQVTLRSWSRQMREFTKDLHLYSAAAAAGGWAQMTPADYGRVGRVLREQYSFLNRFSAEVASGRQILDGRFLQRVKLYAQAGRRMFHLADRALALERGLTEERSILHPADHCRDCVRQASLGFVAIGVLVPIGERECLTNCRCTVEYR